MANKTTVETIFTADTKSALNGISGVVNSLTGLNTNFGGLGSSITTAFKSPTLAIGAVGTALAGIVAHAANVADEMNKTSQKIGITTESLSTLSYVAKLSDVPMETLQKSVAKLSVNLSAAQDGASEQAKAFQRLGVSIKDADGKLLPADQTLMNIADRFSKMPDGIAKTTASMQLMGKNGVEMIPMLNGGADGIKRYTDEARKLGLEISSNTGKQAEAFNDNLTRLKSVAEGFGMSLMSEVIPSLASASDSLVTFAQKGSPAKDFAQGLGGAFKIIGSAGYYLVGALTFAGTALGTLGAAAAKFLTGDFKGAADVIGNGYQRLKDNVNATGDAVAALWSKSTTNGGGLSGIEEQNLALEAQKKKLEALQKSWEKQKATIENELTKQGLNPYLQKLQDIDFATEKLYETYEKIPGALALILRYQDMQKENALGLNQLVNKPLENGNYSITKELAGFSDAVRPQIDTTVSAFDSFFNATNENSIAMRQSLTDSFGYMGQAANSFYAATGSKSKELFALQKGFNIAQAVMNTYEGASKALAQGGIFGGIMAAAVIASGLGMVATIASTQPGSSGGGSSPAVNIPSLPDNNNTGSRDSGSRQNVTINVYTNYSSDPDKFARELAPSFAGAFKDLGLN